MRVHPLLGSPIVFYVVTRKENGFVCGDDRVCEWFIDQEL